MFRHIYKSIIIPILIWGALCLPVTANPGLQATASYSGLSTLPPFLSKPEWEDYYRNVLRLLVDNTMFPGKLDRQYWEHRFDGTLYSADAAQTAVNQVIAALDDEYTYLRNIGETQKRIMDAEGKNTVDWQRISGQKKEFGYLHIKTFASRFVTEETKLALQSLKNVDGYILDLRDNDGGSVEETWKVFSLFCDRGKFVTIKGRLNGKSYCEELSLLTEHYRKRVNGNVLDSEREKNLTGKKPIIVLCNVKTRSAAEMLAGALRDNRRASIIGTKTFGKGVVQNSWILTNGTSIKIAIAYYYLPSGKNIHGCGILPNKIINQTNSDLDNQLVAAKANLYQLIKQIR